MDNNGDYMHLCFEHYERLNLLLEDLETLLMQIATYHREVEQMGQDLWF